jgi:hypothetical protein
MFYLNPKAGRYSRRPNCYPPLLSRATARRQSPAAEILHHKHHAVVLLIQSISPPYLLDQGGRRHRCAVRVHHSEVPPVVALGSDRIARRRWLVRLHHPCSVEHFRCAISSRVWRSHLSILLITSPRLDLGFLVRIRRNFFDLLCCETLQISWNNRFLVRGENILSRSKFSFKLKLIWYTTH